jgi:HSP20 family protein
VEDNAIDMQVEKNILTLKGERKMEKEKNKGKYARVERYYGSFERSFRLPDAVDADNLTASLEKGVLSIRLPKKEETKPRSIKVDMK